VNRWPFILGLVSAIVVALFALPVAISGEIWVPGSVWSSGNYRGAAAYVMAGAWLCLAAGLLFAGCMASFPNRHAEYRRRRDASFVLFGALFVVSTGVIVAKRLGLGAP
jgi:hypothetical protein